MTNELVKILLVEDDEDDYILTKGLLAQTNGRQYVVEWVKSFDRALDTMVLNRHDACLVDYRLGAQDGLELLRKATAQGCEAPIIILTGQGEHEIDMAAMQAGAADYLVKSQLKREVLERSIRYAVDRKRAKTVAAFEHARLSALGTEVGLALTRKDSLQGIMSHCTEAMVKYLNTSVAQITVYDADQKLFNPLATSGSSSAEVAFKSSNLLRLGIESMTQKKPVFINNIWDKSPLKDQVANQIDGPAGYAAYPLLLEERLLGFMSVLGPPEMAESVLSEMQSVSNGIALCIENHRAKEALDASQTKYKAVVENIKEVIFQVDESGNWSILNPAWEKMTGFSVSETLGKPFLEYLHHDDREKNQHVLRQLFERKLDFSCHEVRFLSKAGVMRWVEAYLQLLFNRDGLIIGITGTLSDITERRKVELQVQKLAAFPRHNPNPVLEFSAEGTLTYFNAAAHALAKSLGKKLPQDILPPDASAIVRQCLASTENKLREETVVNGKTISWSFFPISSGNVVHCYGSDITERLSLEAQFRHAQKLESVGQLAAGIAHDFNNLLTVIQGNADLILLQGGVEDETTRQLGQISSAAQRGANLTRQLLMFSRKQVMQTQQINLNDMLQNMGKILPRLLGEDVALSLQCANDLAGIDADMGMIEQVVMNLAVNARDAMLNGGRLLLSTSEVSIDKEAELQNPHRRCGLFVCLSVNDSGSGMSRETLEHIFEPFFTTKQVGKGTGLGLATAFGIVKQHQGWIEVASELNIGTTFKIYFPAGAKLGSSVEEGERATQIAQGRNETVLVVEDEPDLRLLVKCMLKSFGYMVLEAENGPEALKVWDGHDTAIDLVLTDVCMPAGMSGLELGEKIKARRSDAKIIYTTGYNPDAPRNGLGESENVFLNKPYSLQKLAETVRNYLDNELVPLPNLSH